MRYANFRRIFGSSFTLKAHVAVLYTSCLPAALLFPFASLFIFLCVIEYELKYPAVLLSSL